MFVQQLFVFFFVLQIKFSQVPFSTLIFGEMTWSHMICSPKLSDLISYAICTARGGGDLDKNKAMLCVMLGFVFSHHILYFEKIT